MANSDKSAMRIGEKCLIVGLSAVILIFALLFGKAPKDARERVAVRTLASQSIMADNQSCHGLIGTIFSRSFSDESGLFASLRSSLTVKRSQLRESLHRLNPLQRQGQEYRPNWESFAAMRERFIGEIENSPEQFFRRLESGELLETVGERSPEQILAIIHAINFSTLGKRFFANTEQEYLLRELNRLMQKKNGAWDIHDLQSFSARWQKATFFGQSDPVESLLPAADRAMAGLEASDKLLYKTMNRDLITQGLERTLDNYGLFRHRPGIFSRFKNSVTGKVMATGFFNLPVFYGLPPIYLPGLRSLRVPDHLSARLLREGMTRELSDELLDYWSLSGPLWNLSRRQQYEMLRRYYGPAATGYLTFVLYHDFEKQRTEILEEREMIQEMTSGLTQTLEMATELENRGFDIFEPREQDQSVPSGNESSYCEAIRSCFEMIYEETGEMPRSGSDDYVSCKEFMDPDDRCSRY